MNPDCAHTTELLVDFADGELPVDDKRLVTDHLASCPACRAELELLERSLHLAREIWQSNVQPAPQKSASPRRRPELAAAIAVSVVIALASTAWWIFRSNPTKPTVAQHDNHSAKEWTDDAIERFIARETRIARLNASAEILESQPGLEPYAVQAREYATKVTADNVAQP